MQLLQWYGAAIINCQKPNRKSLNELLHRLRDSAKKSIGASLFREIVLLHLSNSQTDPHHQAVVTLEATSYD
jgi:hypothetical protein